MAEALRIISNNVFEIGMAITVFSLSMMFLFVVMLGSILSAKWIVEMTSVVFPRRNKK